MSSWRNCKKKFKILKRSTIPSILFKPTGVLPAYARYESYFFITWLINYVIALDYYGYYDGGYDDSQSDQTITEFHENPESVGFTNKYASLSSAGSPEMGRGFNAYAPTAPSSSAYALHPTLPHAPGTTHHHGHPIKKTYLGRISDERIFASHENFSQISDPSDECPIP